MPSPAGRERAAAPTHAKTPHKPVSRREAAVLPRSLVVKPAQGGGRRKPLEKSRLAMTAVSKRVKKPKRGQEDESAFYLNIWTPPPATRDVRVAKKTRRYVDISQVAHVLTTIDYKSGYEAGVDGGNIWADLQSQQGSMDVEASLSEQRLSCFSDGVISEHGSEDGMAAVPTSEPANALSLGPLRMSSSALRREFASNGCIQAAVASTPVSRPQRKGQSVVFSTVLAAGDEVDMSWNSQFLLGLHEPVRHALYVIDRFLARSREPTASPQVWHASEFFLWFKLHFVEFVKNQHDVKTSVLLPLVVIKFTDKREILACYEAVYVLLDGIMAQEDALSSSAASPAAWQTRLTALQTDIRHLNALLFNVLALEEHALKPAIAQAFSEQAFQRYVMPRVFRASKPKRVVLPWIVERCRVWGGVKAARAYRDDLPFTARFLYDHVWHPYFIANIASAMTHLDSEAETSPTDDSDDSWFGCSVM